jgi:hypothetical protein
MKPEELRRLLEKIIRRATITDQEITATQWEHIDYESSQICYEQQGMAAAKERF